MQFFWSVFKQDVFLWHKDKCVITYIVYNTCTVIPLVSSYIVHPSISTLIFIPCHSHLLSMYPFSVIMQNAKKKKKTLSTRRLWTQCCKFTDAKIKTTITRLNWKLMNCFCNDLSIVCILTLVCWFYSLSFLKENGYVCSQVDILHTWYPREEYGVADYQYFTNGNPQ